MKRFTAYIGCMFMGIFDAILAIVTKPSPEIQRIEHMEPETFVAEANVTDSKDELPDILSFFAYRNHLVKTAILEVKLRGNRRIARLLGKVLYELITLELTDLEIFSNFTHPILVPIPLTRKSLRNRGWNQCELVVKEIERFDHNNVLEIRTDILVKIKETEDQVGKNRIERFRNLKNCFSVHTLDSIKGRNVIVLDDIVTTGATLNEAKSALKTAGARKVVCVAIAH